MSAQDKIDYHSNRVVAEIDSALRAGSVIAARAHFNLSSLHLERLRGLACRTN